MRPWNMKSFDRRRLLQGSAAGITGLTIARPTLGSAQDAGVELVFFGVSGDEENFRRSWDAFSAENPSITVAWEGVPFVDIQNTLQQRLTSGGSGIDIFQVDPTYVPIWNDRGFLHDLTEAFDTDAQAAFSTSNYEGSHLDGKMLTMPIWDSTQILFYNPTLLEAAGIPLPGSNPAERMTWEETIELAQQAQAAGAQYGFAFEQVDRYYQLQPLPESLGGGPGVTGDNLLTVDITNDAWMSAGQWYADIYASGVAPRDLANSAETRGAFCDGQIAFWVAGPWNIPTLNEAQETTGLTYSFAPHPYFEGGGQFTPSESWHWGIASDSEHKEEALELLRYGGLNPEGAALTSSGSMPVANLEAQVENVAIQVASNPDALAGWAELLNYEMTTTAIRRPRTLGYLQLEELVSRGWGDIRQGLDVQETWQKTQADLEPTFERIRPR